MGKKPDSYVVTFTIPKPGDYVINVLFGGENVPNSPFRISVKPPPEEVDVVDAPVEDPESDFSIMWPSDASEQQDPDEVSDVSVVGVISDGEENESRSVSEFSVAAPTDLSDAEKYQLDNFSDMSVMGLTDVSEGETNAPDAYLRNSFNYLKDTTDGKTKEMIIAANDEPKIMQIDDTMTGLSIDHENLVKGDDNGGHMMDPDKDSAVGDLHEPDTDDNERRVKEWICTWATDTPKQELMSRPPPDVTGPSRKYKVVTPSGKKIKAKVQTDVEGKIVWILKERGKKALVIDIIRAV